MILLEDFLMPAWLGVVMMIVSLIVSAPLMMRLWQKAFPSNQEKADFIKVFNDGKYVEFQLSEQLKKMVEAETVKFRDILTNREIEHRQQIDGYITKLVSLQKVIDASEKLSAERELRIQELEKRNSDLEKRIFELEKNIR